VPQVGNKLCRIISLVGATRHRDGPLACSFLV